MSCGARALTLAVAGLLAGCAGESRAPNALVVPNDNRTPAGERRGATLELRLEARQVAWQPESTEASTIHVLAFAEEGGPPRIPGPLLRIEQGTEVRISVRNLIPDSAHIGFPPPRQRQPGRGATAGAELTVHGLRAGTVEDDVVHVPTGTVQEVRFRADKPGTFLYWGAMSRRGIDVRTGTDAQLTGAIVVDPAGSTPDSAERLFVITMTDVFADSSQSPPGLDRLVPVINGLSWPHTERLRYAIGDTVRWRWVNGSFSEHPMHLHGFHFRTLARGDGVHETIYPAAETQLAVTELMEPGSTFRMEWVPARAGNWLMHCHLLDHVTRAPAPGDSLAHDTGDVTQHALSAMAGLVLGVSISENVPTAAESPSPSRLRLVAREKPVPGSPAVIRGFSLAGEASAPDDALRVPGPPLIVTRGDTTAVTVVNQLSEPTTIHWHGIELESVYDGVAGWSRTGSRIAPLIAPRDSFVARLLPPRAGTYIYHVHRDETDQLRGGMYGPLLVLEPGESFNSDRDRVIVVGPAVHDGEYTSVTLNGLLDPPPLSVRGGSTYRLRFINISPDATVELTLIEDGRPARWTSVANDGADLPQPLRVERAAKLRFSTGQTYDFLWTPRIPGDAFLVLDWPFPTEPGSLQLRQFIRVR